MPSRKDITLKGSDGRAIRVTLGVRTKERFTEPIGLLTQSSSGLTKDEHKAFSEWKAQVQSSEVNIKYP